MSTGSVSSEVKALRQATSGSSGQARVLVALATALLTFACGGSDDGGSTPTTPGGPLTFTITSAGVSPKTLTVGAGSQVTFIVADDGSIPRAVQPRFSQRRELRSLHDDVGAAAPADDAFGDSGRFDSVGKQRADLR